MALPFFGIAMKTVVPLIGLRIPKWRMSGRRELSHKCVWFEVLVGNSRRDIEVFEKFGTISQEMGM